MDLAVSQARAQVASVDLVATVVFQRRQVAPEQVGSRDFQATADSQAYRATQGLLALVATQVIAE